MTESRIQNHGSEPRNGGIFYMISQERRAHLQQAVADLTERYRKAGYFPSACVRVFDDRETLAVVCAGEAREHSLFDVASLTKIATATQILRLISAGRLGLDTALGTIFPEAEEEDILRERLSKISIRQLLTHTSGIVDWYPFYSRKGEPFWQVMAYALAHTEPVSGMVYSDLNYMILGKVIERLQEKSLDRCLQEDLVVPLGLGRMMYCPPADADIIPSSYGNPIEERMCRERGIAFDGFRNREEAVRGEVNDGNCHYYFWGVCGLAGIFAEAEAYERLCRYYMNTGDPLLIEAQREQPGAPSRGLGFQTGASYPHGCGHTGFTGTGIWFSRKYRIGAVSMTNRLFYREANPNAMGDFRRTLHEIAFALAGMDT